MCGHRHSREPSPAGRNLIVTSSPSSTSLLFPLLVFLRRTLLLPLHFVGHAWCFFYEVGSRLLHANKLLKQQQQRLLVLLSGPPHVHPCAGNLTPLLSDPYIQFPSNVNFPPFPHMLVMRSQVKQSNPLISRHMREDCHSPICQATKLPLCCSHASSSHFSFSFWVFCFGGTTEASGIGFRAAVVKPPRVAWFLAVG
jgi:hypothetical protein